MNRIEYGVKRNRVSHKIRGHLMLKNISMADIAREIKSSRQLVWATVRGDKHSPRVLDKLRELGVPEKYL